MSDTTITTIARTDKKHKVGSWNNYWYYIQYEAPVDGKDPNAGKVLTHGWVYGEFLN